MGLLKRLLRLLAGPPIEPPPPPIPPVVQGPDIRLALRHVNDRRPTADLLWEDRLASAAQRHAQDIAKLGTRTHVGSDGSTPASRAFRAGYGVAAVGEVLAVVHPRAVPPGMAIQEFVARMWFDSDEHRAIASDDDYLFAGVGMAVAEDGRQFWVLLAAGRAM